MCVCTFHSMILQRTCKPKRYNRENASSYKNSSFYFYFLGAYWCKVTTSVDSVIMLQTLQVMTELPKIQSPKMNVHRAALGSNVTFNCPITQGIPQPTITWKFNGSTLQSNLEK